MMELNYQEFKDYIKENIKAELPKEYEKANVEINPITKNNGILLDVLTIHEETHSISPSIYLNGVYGEYQENGDINEILSKVADLYVNAMEQTPEMKAFDIEQELFSERAKDLITFRVCGYEANKEMLETMPHERADDMAMTYHVIATQTEDGLGSIRITDSLMHRMGLVESELKSLALENTLRMYPPTFRSMMEVIEEMMHGSPVESGIIARELPEDNMYVLSNTSGINGATSLFYPKLQEQIADSLGSNYYVLPSSIHEVLIVPDNGKMSQQELAAMVKEINETQVAPNEVLTNNVYHYDKDEKELTSFLKPKEKQKELKPSMKETLQKAKEEQKKLIAMPKQEKLKPSFER
ncbi:MAG: DUF5688 family protein [Mobilitalea sp.]